MLRKEGSLGGGIYAKAKEGAVKAWGNPELTEDRAEFGRVWREKPLALAAVTSMTLSRLPLGVGGVVESAKGNYWKAAGYFLVDAISDKEGDPARKWKVTTRIGKKLDPVFDLIGLRVAPVAAVAIKDPVTAVAMGVGETVNLGFNASIQPGREEAYVPNMAKVGTAYQAGGMVVYCAGKAIESSMVTQVGKNLMEAGTILRVGVYGKEFLKTKFNSKKRNTSESPNSSKSPSTIEV